MRLFCSLVLFVCCLFIAPARAQSYAPPRFTETDRAQKIGPVKAEIDKVFADIAAERHIPAIAYGVMLDGALVHTGAIGLANVERKLNAVTDTRFRIASMTKSFTALAILKLRDAGKLSLHDPVANHITEFKQVAPLTS